MNYREELQKRLEDAERHLAVAETYGGKQIKYLWRRKVAKLKEELKKW